MGNPVEHSRSPWIHARFAELTGQALHYDTPPGAAGRLCPGACSAFAAAGGRGCNVTVPFKFEAAQAGHAPQRARATGAGAANTLTFKDGAIHADNTDGLGLVDDIERNAGIGLAGRDVLLIGAGGAAAGVLGPLLDAGPRQHHRGQPHPGPAHRHWCRRHASLGIATKNRATSAIHTSARGQFRYYY